MTTPDEGQHHVSYVLVDPWTGDCCAIDAELVDLITQLWRLGVRTRYCCQGEPGDLASVTIYDAESATRLVGLLGYSHARQLGSRVGWDGVRRPRHTDPRWRWGVRPWSPGPGEWLLQMTLYMPVEDARAAARHLAKTEAPGVKASHAREAEPAGGEG